MFVFQMKNVCILFILRVGKHKVGTMDYQIASLSFNWLSYVKSIQILF